MHRCTALHNNAHKDDSNWNLSITNSIVSKMSCSWNMFKQYYVIFCHVLSRIIVHKYSSTSLVLLSIVEGNVQIVAIRRCSLCFSNIILNDTYYNSKFPLEDKPFVLRKPWKEHYNLWNMWENIHSFRNIQTSVCCCFSHWHLVKQSIVWSILFSSIGSIFGFVLLNVSFSSASLAASVGS